MNHWEYTAVDCEATNRLAERLAKLLPAGTTVGLVGTLGAGKSYLVRQIAAACGVPAESVVSPTYVLCQEYHADRSIYHLDAYRIADDDEFLELGVDEYFDSDALKFVEWSDRVARCMPEDCLQLQIEIQPDGARTFSFTAANADQARMLELLSM